MQRLAAHGARIDNQLGIVPVIRFFLAEVFPPHDMQLRKIRRITVKCIQTSPVFRKSSAPCSRIRSMHASIPAINRYDGELVS